MTATDRHTSSVDRQRVAVVTGGGGGIGGAIAEELGRTGTFVVTVDPLVTVDGSEQIPTPEESTAGRIVAAGGSARASTVSVTDRAGVRHLFESLVDEFGGLDAVVNVAGISRPTSFAKGAEEDWIGVLSVHLDGYLNILGAALPIMAAAGHGRILGVTSGSGWRAANTGAYGCAKRAVAALTWQLGAQAPPGVVVNAMSPIAATRMVAAALGSARSGGAARTGAAGRPGGGGAATGGLSLDSMPSPDQLGPLGAHLVDDCFGWCSGQVIFAGGSEVAVIAEPRLLEVVRADRATSLAGCSTPSPPVRSSPPRPISAATAGATPGSGRSSTGRAATRRRRRSWDRVRSSPIVPEVANAITAALDGRGVTCTTVLTDDVAPGFDGAIAALNATAERDGPLDAVVVALAGTPAVTGATQDWERVLDEHAGLVEQILADVRWSRAVAEYAATAERRVRVVTLTDATTAGGRSRAQASAQLARSARSATDDRVAAFPISVETPWSEGSRTVSELVAHLLGSDDSTGVVRSRAHGRHRPDRPPQPSSPERQHHVRRTRRPRLARRHAGQHRRCDRSSSVADDERRRGEEIRWFESPFEWWTPTCTCGIPPEPTGTRTCRVRSS